MSLLIQKTAVEFVLDNTFLATGQAGQESDTGLIKIGRGNWNDLDYSTPNTNAFEQVLSGLSYKVPSSYAVDQAITGGIGSLTLAQVLTNGNDAEGQDILNVEEISTTVGNYKTFSYYQDTGDYFSSEVINAPLGEHVSLALSLETPGSPYALLASSSATGTTSLTARNANILLAGSAAGFQGAVYSADYSASYTNRSLVDKEYVDDLADSLTLSEVLGNGNDATGQDILNLGQIDNSVGSTETIIDHTSGFWQAYTSKNTAGNLNQAYFEVWAANGTNNPYAFIQVASGLTFTDFEISKSDILFRSNVAGFKGATYDADYSANYTNRSLVDKEYVDDTTGALDLDAVLTNGNTAGAHDIIMNVAQAIYSVSGSKESRADFGANFIQVGVNDTSTNAYSYTFWDYSTQTNPIVETDVQDSLGNVTSLVMGVNNMSLNGGKAGFTGFEYGADYSANYTNRSLVDKAYVLTTVASYVAGLLDYRGTYSASSNLYPATGGSGVGGAILKGDLWVISVAGTLGGTPVEPGDLIIANVDTPGQTGSNWDELQNNIGFTPENVVNKETGSAPTDSTTLYPSSHTVYTALATKEDVANKDTDGTLAANSDVKYPSQKAVKTYVDAMTTTFRFDYVFIDGKLVTYTAFEDLRDLISLTCHGDEAILAKTNAVT